MPAKDLISAKEYLYDQLDVEMVHFISMGFIMELLSHVYKCGRCTHNCRINKAHIRR